MPAVTVSNVTTTLAENLLVDPEVLWKIYNIDGGETLVADWDGVTGLNRNASTGWDVTGYSCPLSDPDSTPDVLAPADSDGSYRLEVFCWYDTGMGDGWHRNTGNFTVSCSDTLAQGPISALTGVDDGGSAYGADTLYDGNYCNGMSIPDGETEYAFWIDLGNGNAAAANTFEITNGSTATAGGDNWPVDFTLWGANTGPGTAGNRTTLDTYVSQSWEPPNRRRVFTVTNVTAYRYYGMTVTDREIADWLTIGELRVGIVSTRTPGRMVAAILRGGM